MVGKEASDAAWLIVQHSVSDPAFMLSSYKLMSESKADIELSHLAMLYDRIQFFQGKPQKFGTQMNDDSTIFPVENKAKLNMLRTEFGLPKLSDQVIDKIRPAEDISKIENENPDYVMWRNKVGWNDVAGK